MHLNKGLPTFIRLVKLKCFIKGWQPLRILNAQKSSDHSCICSNNKI